MKRGITPNHQWYRDLTASWLREARCRLNAEDTRASGYFLGLDVGHAYNIALSIGERSTIDQVNNIRDMIVSRV